MSEDVRPFEEYKEMIKDMRKEEMIKGLYDLSKNINEKSKEIERLKKREQECIDHYLVQCKYASEMENKYITANNIINEFDKWLEEQLMYFNDNNGAGGFSTNIEDLEIVKEKLQELKGDKEYKE